LVPARREEREGRESGSPMLSAAAAGVCCCCCCCGAATVRGENEGEKRGERGVARAEEAAAPEADAEGGTRPGADRGVLGRLAAEAAEEEEEGAAAEEAEESTGVEGRDLLLGGVAGAFDASTAAYETLGVETEETGDAACCCCAAASLEVAGAEAEEEEGEVGARMAVERGLAGGWEEKSEKGD